MLQLFLIAFRNLIQNSRRTLLLGGAISGVTALLVFLLCLTAGIHATMLESATTLSTGHINVGGFYKATAGQSAPVITGYKKLFEIVTRTLTDLDFVVPRGRGWAKLVSETGVMQVGIAGINIADEPRFQQLLKVSQGKLADLSQPGTILIFQQHAKKLGVGIGDNLVFSAETPRGVANTLDVRVVAIAEDMGFMSSWTVLIPDESLRHLNQINDETTGALYVYLKDIEKIPQDLDKLREAFAAAGYRLMDREAKPFWGKFQSVNREDWTGQKLDLTTWEEESSYIKWIITALDGLMYLLIIILLIIISIGIMNSIWIAIRERTREIGTLRAIGMQRRRVLSMFMIEAFTLGLLGTLGGTLLGLTLAGLLNAAHLPVPTGAQMFLMSSTLKFSFEFTRILAGMTLITTCTTLIAIIPAIHAARMKPITAMQHIG